MNTALNTFESVKVFSLGYFARHCYEGKREPFANLKDLQNVITDKRLDVDIRQPESKKPYVIKKSV